MLHVTLAKTFRYQDLQIFAQQLLPRVAEQTFRLRVERFNHAVLGNDDHRIGRVLESAGKQTFVVTRP